MRNPTSAATAFAALFSLLLPLLAGAGDSLVDPNAVIRNYYGALRNFDPHSDYIPPANRHRVKRAVCSSKGSVQTSKGQVIVTAPTTKLTTTTALTSKTSVTTTTAVVASPSSSKTVVVAAPSTTTTQTSATASSTSTPARVGTVGGYFPDWNLDVMTPAQIDYTKYDWLQFCALFLVSIVLHGEHAN